MHFDHLLGAKKVGRSIANLASKGWVKQLLAELPKTELVCAPCHRLRHKARLAALRISRGALRVAPVAAAVAGV